MRHQATNLLSLLREPNVRDYQEAYFENSATFEPLETDIRIDESSNKSVNEYATITTILEGMKSERHQTAYFFCLLKKILGVINDAQQVEKLN